MSRFPPPSLTRYQQVLPGVHTEVEPLHQLVASGGDHLQGEGEGERKREGVGDRDLGRGKGRIVEYGGA